jgi:hypothetical protein
MRPLYSIRKSNSSDNQPYAVRETQPLCQHRYDSSDQKQENSGLKSDLHTFFHTYEWFQSLPGTWRIADDLIGLGA